MGRAFRRTYARHQFALRLHVYLESLDWTPDALATQLAKLTRDTPPRAGKADSIVHHWLSYKRPIARDDLCRLAFCLAARVQELASKTSPDEPIPLRHEKTEKNLTKIAAAYAKRAVGPAPTKDTDGDSSARLAALAKLAEEECAACLRDIRGNALGPDDLDQLLNQLLEDVGFASIRGRPKNQVSHRLQMGDPGHRVLRIAAPFCESKPFASYLDHLTAAIGNILGVDLEIERSIGSDFTSHLRTGSIDAAAAVLRSPMRSLDCLFTRAFPFPVPRIGVCGVVDLRSFPQECWAAIETGHFEPPENLRVLCFERSIIGGQEGGFLGKWADRTRRFPVGQIAVSANMLEEAAKALRTEPNSMLLTDDICALEMLQRSAPNLRRVVSCGPHSRRSLRPLCWAVHLREPELASVLDFAIDELDFSTATEAAAHSDLALRRILNELAKAREEPGSTGV